LLEYKGIGGHRRRTWGSHTLWI